MWFEEALQRARELDDHFAQQKSVVGPFHGLPFSVKNQFGIKGKRVYTGFLAWVNNIAERDAPVIKFLRDSGAVFFCQTVRLANPRSVDCALTLTRIAPKAFSH